MSDPARDDDRLRPYLPRLVTHWLAEEPELRSRTVAGSVVFVDISGFTKLSEQLARNGRIGAEQLSGAIDTCFARLLGVAYSNGGALLKFGGDALLLLFRGPQHALDACRAAAGMRAALRNIGAIEAVGRRVSLRMSVGVHSGDFDLFLVGDSHRELLIAGPAASHTVDMEAAAEAGEIVLSADTAEALSPGLVGAPKGRGFLLRRQPPGLSPLPPDTPSLGDSSQPALGLSTLLRAHLRDGGGQPEHKHVTVAFVHFDGTDALVRHGGRDAAAGALDRLVGRVQQAADAHGVCFLGSDIDRDGGKLILTAGAPVATGHDADAMLRTLRVIVDDQSDVPVRAGVNAGPVFAGDIGPGYRRTYTVMGDAVNLAARVMARAAPGQLMATDAVMATTRREFEHTPVEPFLVKGKSRPVHAALVGAASQGERRTPPAGRLFGRDRELAALLGALELTRAGRGGVAEVIGEPGMGKTRLVEELVAHADGMRVLRASCDAYTMSSPYLPWRMLLRGVLDADPTVGDQAVADELRRVLARRAPHLLPWFPLLAIPLGVEVPQTEEVRLLDAEFRLARMAEAIEELLSVLVDTPTLAVIDDVHWMDDASNDLLSRLDGRCSERPLLLCLTRLDVVGGFRASGGLSIRLTPLDGESAVALADAAAGEQPLPPHVLNALAERAAGNPLFLSQLVVAAREQEAHALPTTVEGLLRARIDRLQPPDRAALGRLAVLGRTFSGDLATAVLADAGGADRDLWTRLAEFIETSATGDLRFRHALVRDAAYDSLPFRTRQQLHARAGELLERSAGEDSARFPLLAMHFFEARDYLRAWDYARQAAEHARAVHANVQATEAYERALEAARREPSISPADVADVQEALGDVCKHIGDFARAAGAYRQARRARADDPLAQARLLLKQGSIYQVSGRYPQALRWLRRAHKVADAAPQTEAARLRARVAVAYASVGKDQGRPVQTIRWCMRALQEAHESRDLDTLARAYSLLDASYVELGRWDEATYSTRALALFQELGDLWGQGVVYNNLGIQAYWRGDWDEAVALYEKGRHAWETMGDSVSAAFGTVNIGEILSDQGRLEDAEPMFRSALRVWRAAGDRAGTAYAMRNLARLLGRRGRYDEAVELFDRARAEFDAVGGQLDVVETELRLAELLLLRGDAAAALPILDELLPVCTAPTTPLRLASAVLLLLGQTGAQLGDPAVAAQRLTEVLDVAFATNSDFDAAQALLTLAAVQPPGAAADEARASATRILHRLGVVEVALPPLAPPTTPMPRGSSAPVPSGGSLVLDRPAGRA